MRVLGATWLLALVLLGVGCGLPSSYYLSPPTGPSALDPFAGSFQISSSSANSEPEFRGFELYYKFYADAANVEINLGGSANDVATLTNAHFLTVCSLADTNIDSRTPPLILIDPNDRGLPFTITINMDVNNADGSKVNFSYTNANTTEQVQIRRHVKALPTAGGKAFTFNTFLAGNYVKDEADVPGITSNPTSGVIYLAMYAVSYGLQDVSTPIYSYPVYLGYLTLTPFTF